MRSSFRRRAIAALVTASAVAGQVAAFTLAPEQLQYVACWTMSLLWVAAIEVTFRPARPRPPAVFELRGREQPLDTPAGEDERQPSARMRDAWAMARTGGDTETVAHVAQVPYSLAELIVADARTDSGEQR